LAHKAIIPPAKTGRTPKPSQHFSKIEAADRHSECLHLLFEAQVEQTPEAIALIFEHQRLTYREVNNRANKLAHYLLQSQLKPETLVSICADRSVEMVVALLAVLKVGAAYVPVDPAYPPERVKFMLDDCRSPVLLTQKHLLKSLPVSTARVICLDADWPSIDIPGAHNLSIDPAPDNLAYVIYTSGSTGKPKGAMNTHRGICNRVLWMQDAYRLDSTDRVLQKTPFSFDVSVWEFFWPLITGAALVIARPLGHHDNAYLAKVIYDERITTLHFVPSMLQLLLDEPDLRQSCITLRRVICSGEALSYDLQNRFFKHLDAELHNLYGPTEAAVDVTFWPCTPDDEMHVVPIGRPITNAQIHLLDQRLEPVPVGVAGELHIGGTCLARGYLNRADLTADRFIPHPLATQPGERLYKTGDLARYLPNGAIEYIGRVDHQVKICGVRIELGEIEAAIVEHSSVRETVVLAREDTPGDKRLVAYLSANDAIKPSNGELRSFLQKRLPHYMVPAAFVWMEKLPLTPNGKIDRVGLPPPADFSRDGQQVTLPRTPIEDLIAGVWREVMGLRSLSIHDNFFELGGHSLLASMLVSRLRRCLQAELSVPDVFDSPTVAQLAAKIDARRQAGNRRLITAPTRDKRRDIKLRLSPAQQRLWFLHRLKPESAFYNLPLVVRLHGRLNVAALEESFKELSRRHEVLRTRFVETDGWPLLVVDEPSPPQITVLEVSDTDYAQKEEDALRIVQAQVRASFDITKNPPWRIVLVRLSKEEHLLAIVMHHLISDGWSLNVLAKELSLVYSAYVEGRTSPLAELPIEYRDYAAWQSAWLSQGAEQEQLEYWQKQLESSQIVLQLPSDRPRPSAETYEGNTYHTTLPAHLAEALKSLSRRESSTLFMTLIAAFNVLLYRYTGQQDINIGTPLAGRNCPEAENLIGFFVNTVVIRTQLSGNMSFRELLQHVRETTLAAYAHQEIPFESLVEALHIDRSLSHAPVFQVVFGFNNMPNAKLELIGLQSTVLEIDTATAKFDLAFLVEDMGAELKLAVEYNTALFNVETIERMTRHFQTQLESIVAYPEQRLSTLQLLTDGESNQMIVLSNDTRTDFPQDACIHQLFERQVQRAPHALAVVCENERLTYSELNRKSNQLARRLRSMGVGPESLVGICVQRSEKMIGGALAVLKAGGAYVPFDPAYPKDRIATMVKDASPKVLLTEQSLLESLPPCDALVFCLDTEAESLITESDLNLPCTTHSENLAYVIFTSGSTGKPKGVELQHGGLVNLALWHQQSYGLDDSSRVSQVAGMSFDAAVWEIWGNLIAGAGLYIPDEKTALSPTEFWGWLETRDITHSFLPTALVENLLALAEARIGEDVASSPNTLRYLFTGGDKLHRRPKRRLPFSLVNLYGPTETTVVSTAAVVESAADTDVAPSIGVPINNTQVYILDPQLQPVPFGVPGELYIGGVGLSRGYRTHSQLTAERFIPNPYGGARGERMYRTGDLARYLSNGQIECLGRVDEQVKIRGFRIELGEIETRLSQHEAVREAAVVVAADNHYGGRLIAYVVAGAEQQATAGELRSYVKNTLPEYMIPAAFVTLEALPLTPNGKVDRRRLSAMEAVQPEVKETYVSPRSELERGIAGVWQEVLKVQKVGVHDNFFNLGGHSLLIVQVNDKLREALQIDVSIVDMFKYPTVSSLAEHLSDRAIATVTSPVKTSAQTRIEARNLQTELRRQRRQTRTAEEAFSE